MAKSILICDDAAFMRMMIKDILVKNGYNKEIVYNLLIEANGLMINVGINEADLQGDPKVGRRFRGEIWLQGVVTI